VEEVCNQNYDWFKMIYFKYAIDTYLPISIRNPNFPNTPITAKMLLTHTSSLASTKTDADAPGIWAEFHEDQAPSLSEWIPQFLLPSGKYFSAPIWQPDRPGQFELYSNIGSCVLAYMVEYLTGQDFREYCRAHIFDPLDMHNTSYYYKDLDQNKTAVLYQYNSTAHPGFDVRLHASSSAKTTLNDLARFLMAYMYRGEIDGTRILAEHTVEKILTVQNSMSGCCLIWGASLGGWIGHSGALGAGATAMAEIHPPSKTAFIIFCNKFPSFVEQGDEIYGLVRQRADGYIK
jgi:CubicO group peptidase (beta-lactamase class C family)